MIKSFLKKQILFLVIVFLYRFNRKLVIGKENLDKVDSFIVVSWHGKILGLMEFLKNKGYFALVSQSRDGDLIVDVAKKFGYNFFRGSSNRGGQSAMNNMNNFFSDRKSAKIIITPDGPTGPEHKAKPGAFLLSQKSGNPVVPVTLLLSFAVVRGIDPILPVDITDLQLPLKNFPAIPPFLKVEVPETDSAYSTISPSLNP